MITIYVDYETSERAGAGGCFQIISIIQEIGGVEKDITGSVDLGYHYQNGKDVISDLGLNPNKVDFTIETL